MAAHDWKTLRDTLNYLQNVGVNAIEIMPFNEFESNNSWGSVTQEPSRFQVFKMKQNARGQSIGVNPMQKAKEKKGF